MTSCNDVPVPCPHKEKIHKQWCLFDQHHHDNHHQDQDPLNTGDLLDLRTEVEEEGKIKVNKGNVIWALSEVKNADNDAS